MSVHTVTNDVNTDERDHTQGPTVCIRTSSPHTPMPHHVTVAPYEGTDGSSVCRKALIYASSYRYSTVEQP